MFLAGELYWKERDMYNYRSLPRGNINVLAVFFSVLTRKFDF